MPEKSKQNKLKLGKAKIEGSTSGEGAAKQIDIDIFCSDERRHLKVCKEEKEPSEGPKYVFNIDCSVWTAFPIEKVNAGDIGALFDSNNYVGIVRALLPVAESTVKKIVSNDKFALGAVNEASSSITTTQSDATYRLSQISANAVNLEKHLEMANIARYNLAHLISDTIEWKGLRERLHLSKRKS